MRRLLSLPVLLSCLSPAMASGGLWCDVDDDKVTVAINSGVGRGMGGPLFNFEGTIEIKDPALPDDVRKTSYDHAVQYWLDGKELNLVMYWERVDGDFASVEGTFTTRSKDDEGGYAGEYEISIYGGTPSGDEPLRLSGAFSCGVE